MQEIKRPRVSTDLTRKVQKRWRQNTSANYRFGLSISNFTTKLRDIQGFEVFNMPFLFRENLISKWGNIEMIRALLWLVIFFIGRSIDILLDSFHTYHSGLLVWYNVYVFAYLLTFQTYLVLNWRIVLYNLDKGEIARKRHFLTSIESFRFKIWFIAFMFNWFFMVNKQCHFSILKIIISQQVLLTQWTKCWLCSKHVFTFHTCFIVSNNMI